jgi:hypothetical protein
MGDDSDIDRDHLNIPQLPHVDTNVQKCSCSRTDNCLWRDNNTHLINM